MIQIPDFHGFLVQISEISDGDFRERTTHSEIIRPEKQDHGTMIHTITSENIHTPFSHIDGVYTREKGIPIGSLGADCPTIVLMGDGECATLHSGWRGTKAQIAASGLALFHTPRANIQVYIGPHIRVESYEVQEDFLVNFDKKYFQKGEKIFFDMTQCIKDTFIGLGIEEQNIIIDTRNTFTDTTLYSYRRNPTLGAGCVSIIMR